jgi:signal transduction histidine kinase
VSNPSSAPPDRPAAPARWYPAFVADMARPENRPQLWTGVRSGYALAALFALLAFAGDATGVLPEVRAFYVLVLLKLATNTLALWSLRNGVLPLEIGGLNVVMDVVTMTGAIYLTGGPLSPLFAIYVIEISVIALLTNLGITVAIAAFAWVLHGGVTILAHTGVIPLHPPPAVGPVQFTDAQIALALVYALFVIAVPTLFTSAILRSLQRKERELQRTNAELVDAAKQKSWFMANITHELRTPIHGICGMSDLVTSGIYGPVNAKQREAQRTIKQSAQGLLGLIDGLLDLSRAEAAQSELKVAPIPVRELVEGVMASVRPMVGTKDLHLEWSADPQLPALATDRGLLVQVLVNLLGNAIKFTPEGGHISLRAMSVRGGVAFEVRDTGVGIPEEELPRIFEAFRQVDGSDERQFGGVGLGLALVDRWVKLLGGSVEVQSGVGAGTVFTVWLPVAPPQGSAR